MDNFKFGSVCSGIEAASVAWYPLGCRASWLAEVDAFPSAVLAHHFPGAPNLGDMTKIASRIESGEIEAPDVLVGGTPCQAFSVAGMREGLSDPRGELTIKFVELANAIDIIRKQRNEPESIIVWENVPGVLSSKDNAFGCFLGALAGTDGELQPAGGGRWTSSGCVYGPQRAIAWRVLDAQYFGLAQRRKRVFVVASARKGFDPAKVLFEFDGVRRDIAPSREAGKEIAGDVGTGTKTASHWDGIENPHPTLSQSHNTGGIGASNQELFSQRGAGLVQQGFRKLTFESYAQDETASTMMARDYKSYTDLVAYGMPGNWIGRKPENGGNSTQFMHEVAPAQTVTDRHGVVAITCATKQQAMTTEENMASTLAANDYKEPRAVAVAAYRSDTAVRRLTPVECERLQGFPDGYTAIPWRGKPAEDCPDGHRYKALGNSMAVPVMQWIGKRISEALK